MSRWNEAVTSLDAFEATDPGRGQTSLLLGQAYRGMGNHEKATAAFTEAARREPALAPQTTKFLADVQASQRAPGSFGSAQSPRSQSLRTQGQQVGEASAGDAAPTALTWDRRTRGAAGFSFGNNSNVISLGDSTLAGEISSTSDTFIQMWADLSADWQFDAEDGLTLGYFGSVTNYDDLSAFDFTDHIAFVTWRHLFDPKWQGTLSVADDYAALGGTPFRNVFSVRPAISYLLEDNDSLELALYYSHNSFFFVDLVPQFDRDGDTTSLALTHYFHIEGTRFTGRAGYYHLWNSTRGSDFDFESDGVLLGLNHPIGRKGANVYAFYSHTWDDYDNLNSLTAFSLAREEESDRFTLQVSVPVQRQINAFGRYEITDVESNIGAFTFDQEIISGGIVASF